MREGHQTCTGFSYFSYLFIDQFECSQNGFLSRLSDVQWTRVLAFLNMASSFYLHIYLFIHLFIIFIYLNE